MPYTKDMAEKCDNVKDKSDDILFEKFMESFINKHIANKGQ
jgi:hypothetical protein